MEDVSSPRDFCLLTGRFDIKMHNDRKDTLQIIHRCQHPLNLLILADAVLPVRRTLLIPKHLQDQTHPGHHHNREIRIGCTDDLRSHYHHLPKWILDELHTTKGQRILQYVVLWGYFL